MRATFIVLIGSVFLAACGGGGAPSNEVGEPSQSSQSSSSLSSSESSLSDQSSSTSESELSSVNSSSLQSSQSSDQSSSIGIDYGKIISTPQTENPLVLSEGATFIDHIKNGIRLQLTSGYGDYIWVEDGLDPRPPGPFIPDFVSVEDRFFSQKNEYVTGSDASDYAKYDGIHWFVSRFPDNSEGSLSQLQIIKTDTHTPAIEIVGELDFDELWGNPTETYLVQQDNKTTHIAAIRNIWGDIDLALPGSLLMGKDDPFRRNINSFWYKKGPQNGKVRIQAVDVTSPDSPANDWDIKIDGSLIKSKKVGNILYLITRYDPWLNGLKLKSEYREAVRESNEDLLSIATESELLPSFQVGSNKQLLTAQCFLQESTESHHGLGYLTYVTAVDLVNKTLLSSQCINSGVDTFHMSTNALYLTGTVYNEALEGSKTVIHKFSLGAGGAEYAATGSVPGYLWGGGNAELRLHEYENNLRIITSSWGKDTSHKLFVLEEKESELAVISELPNSVRADSVGRSGEQIHSVRFDGTRAFIATTNQTDPRYVIDLSNTLDLRSSGEISILGFETYLHPIDERYLLTFGREGNDYEHFKGIKIELIDTSEGASKVIDTLLLGSQSGYSEALNNLHALNFNRINENQLRFSMPIEHYNEVGQFVPIRESWEYSGLQLFEVNGLSNDDARLTNAGVIVIEEKSSSQVSPIYEQGSTRNVLHDDAIFFFYNNSFWAADWNSPVQVNGLLSNGED